VVSGSIAKQVALQVYFRTIGGGFYHQPGIPENSRHCYRYPVITAILNLDFNFFHRKWVLKISKTCLTLATDAGFNAFDWPAVSVFWLASIRPE